MNKPKKSYQDRLKDGIPKVISYVHSPLQFVEIKFHKETEGVTYDRKDIYDDGGRLEKIDLTKPYISAFDI